MPFNIEDFFKRATHDQKQHLYKIFCLADQQQELDKISEQVNRELIREANHLYHQEGSNFKQITDLQIDPRYEATRRILNREAARINSEVKLAFEEAVTSYGMAELGYIQRYYRDLTGKDLPKIN